MTSEHPSGTRRRAVRLTDKGQAVLLAALEEAWRRESPQKPITRKDRARILAVSQMTAQKIVDGQGVDRASLVIAFGSLKLDWKDSYCEYVLRSPTKVDQPVNEGSPSKELKSLSAWGGVAAALAVMATVIGLRDSLANQSGVPTGLARDHVAQALVEQATAEYNTGRYSDGRQTIRRAELLARRLKNAPILANALVIDGHLRAELGDFNGAKECYASALDIRKLLRQPETYPPLLESLATVEADQGELGEATSHLLQCLKGFETQKDEPGVALAYRDLGSVATQAGQYGKAHEWFDSALKTASQMDKPELTADIQARKGALLRDEGNLDEARKLFSITSRFWESRGHKRWIAQSLFERGTVETLAGDFTSAHDLLSRSEVLFRSVGDSAGVSKCRSWQQRASVKLTAGRRSPAPTFDRE